MHRDEFNYCLGFYLKLLVVCVLLSAVSFVWSSENAAGQLMEDIDTPPIIPVIPDVLWDQTAGISSADISSQNFTDGGGAFDQFDTRAADDFLVPDGFVWIIDTVAVFGAFDGISPDNIESLNVYFFTDGDGLPDKEIPECVYGNILPEDITVPNFVIDLPEKCKHLPGLYWVSVQTNISFTVSGQWFWHENTVLRLDPFVWENPGDGFTTGCVEFSPAQADCGADDPDLAFQLAGQEAPIIRPIPTLGEWGMIATAVTLGFIAIAVFAMKKRSA